MIKHANHFSWPWTIAALASSIALGVTIYRLYASQPIALNQRTVTHYVCSSCGLKCTYNATHVNPPVEGQDNSKNFSCVITHIAPGRWRPVIETERLRLREVTPEDIPVYHTYFTNPETASSATWRPHTIYAQTEKKVYETIKKNRDKSISHWAICLKESDLPVGFGGFTSSSPSNHQASIGWWIDSTFWNHGYATELAKALIEYGMKYMGLNRIDALVQQDNAASRKVLEKAGMSFYAKPRQYIRLKGLTKTYYILGILKKEVLSQLAQSKV